MNRDRDSRNITVTANRGAIRKLRQVLKDDAETPRFIQTVTGQGYRFVALVTTPKEPGAVSEPEAAGVPTSDRDFLSELDSWFQARRLRIVEPDRDHPAEEATDAGTGLAKSQSLRSSRAPPCPSKSRSMRNVPPLPLSSRPTGGICSLRGAAALHPVHPSREKSYRWLFVAGALVSVACLLAFLAVWGWRRASNPPTHPQGKIVLAVLPFENLSHDPDQEFFSDGLTEEMIAQTGKLNRNQLTVVASSSVAKYKGTKLAAKDPIFDPYRSDHRFQELLRRIDLL